MGSDHTLQATSIEVRESSTHDGRVARLVLRSPPENALDITLLRDLGAALERLSTKPGLACVVLEGDGIDFSTGLLLGQRRRPYVELLLENLHGVARRLAAIPALTVAKVKGRCHGAGFELALLCDIVVNDQTARFAFPELSIGAIPTIAPAILPARLGVARAHELVLSGRTIPGDEALAAGLATEVAGGWDDVESLVQKIVEKQVLPRSTVALRAQAIAFRRPLVDLLSRTLDESERHYLEEVALTKDADEGVTAALRRRTPKWTHS